MNAISPRLTVVRTAKGKLRLDCDGQKVLGVSHIDVVDHAHGGKAEVIITVLGSFITFETETQNDKDDPDVGEISG